MKRVIKLKFIWCSGWHPEGGYEKGEEPLGPIFNQWLPNGINDKLVLFAQGDMGLSVFCNRYGIVRDGRVVFSKKSNLVDELAISKNYKLYGGPIFIELTYPIDNANLEKIIKRDAESKIDAGKLNESNNYEDLGKDIYELVYSKMFPFGYTLKYRYGQYWMEDFPKFDSRLQTIGGYFSNLRGVCFIDDKEYRFLPLVAQNTIELESMMHGEDNGFLSEEDWKNLGKSVPLEKSICNEFLIRAHLACWEGDLNQAFIESATALELSISKVVTKDKKNGSFFDLSLSARLSVISQFILKDDPEQLLEGALKAIEIRNDIVHEGFIASKKDRKFCLSLIRMIILMLGLPKIRLPIQYTGASWRTA